MAAVWSESRAQARQMMKTFSHNVQSTFETGRALEGIKILAINVMLVVAYGQRVPWSFDAGYAKPPPGYAIGFVESMKRVVDNLIPAAFVPNRVLSWKYMPLGAKKLQIAKAEFPRYANALISEQRNSGKVQDNFLSTLVRAADESSQDVKSNSCFSESEIIGNVFNITIAGFDTTANAIAYAFLALALYPEWQDWVFGELDSLGPSSGVEEYESEYPRLVRCMALLASHRSIETLSDTGKTDWRA